MNKPTYSLNIEVMNGQELFLHARPIPLIGFRPTESTGDVEYCDDYPSTPVQDRLYVTPTGARIYRGGRFIEFPVLDATGRLRIAQMPDGISGGDDGEYIPVEWRGRANGVASLNARGVVPSSQLPQMNYIPKTEKGASNGVATLGQDGKVPSGQLPLIKSDTAWDEVTDKPEFAEVATTGSYNDLEDKPDLTTKANLVQGKVPEGELPIATNSAVGCVKTNEGKGTLVDANGVISISPAGNILINSRGSANRPIVPSTLDYAVRSVLPNVTTIPAATTAYSLLDASATTNNHSWQYAHAPASASTYTFPAVTNTAVAHRIKLTIDFTDTQTYSFEDTEGAAIIPLFTPTIAAGDVYEFDCEYSAVKGAWLIWPHKQGAVSDDYVMQSQVGAANGVAPLNSSRLVPTGMLPTIGGGGLGVSSPGGLYGLSSLGQYMILKKATDSAIDERVHIGTNQAWGVISPDNINYAVAAALTDAKKISLTDAQKASAQDALGVGAAPIIGTTVPTTSTAGSVGQLYVDTATSKTYHCTAVTNTGTESEPVMEYTWTDDINENGGRFFDGINIQAKQASRYMQLLPSARLVNGTNHTVAANCSSILATGEWHTVKGLTYSCLLSGAFLQNNESGQNIFGKFNNPINGAIIVGGGTSRYNIKNILELAWNGDLYISGGHQQGVTTIPAATTAYTLAEGVQSHTPSAATTYTLPAIHQRIIADGRYFTRNPAADGTGYYGWLSGTTNRYTASATPAVGDNTYTNTALTSGAKAITAIDNRTHECILDIDFSTVQTFSFEDAEGNELSLQKDITVLAGDKWRFICIYEYGMWLIYPLQLKAETVTPTTPVSISGDTATAISEQLSATASGNGILSYTATGLPDGVTCSSTGLISGTPTTAGTYEATVTVRTPYSKPATITVNFTITQAS